MVSVSELVQRYGEKITATYAANVAFFKEKLPGFHDQMLGEPGNVVIQAYVDSEGLINLGLNGVPLALQDLLDQSRATLRAFEAGERPHIIVRTPESLPDGAPHPDNHAKRYFITGVDYHQINKQDVAFAAACKPGAASARPAFGVREIPILIVFGSGYGTHLIDLLDHYDIRHLILVDNDPAITRLSMGFTDYVAIYNNHLIRGIKFSFLSHTNPDKLVDLIIEAIQTSWPPYFVHGISVFRNLRNVELCEKVESGLAEKLWLSYRGWGFFDDEMLSIRHSIANLNSGMPVCRPKNNIDPKAAAIIVGNGPSLDGLVDLIRQHQDKVVIVSCGSALSALYRLGITPDYHIEIERTYSTVESIRYVVPDEFLANIRAVGTNVLHPHVFDGFKEKLMLVKGGDSSGNLFPGGCLAVNTFPTVTNGAVSWLIGMGFKRVYLMGVDLGAKDAAKHHSQSSLYYAKDDVPEGYVEQLNKGDTIHMSMETDANFGDGKVRTNDILTLARMSIESVLRVRPDAKVFNLSDGARIAGSEPLQPDKFELPDDVPEKTATIASIGENFEVLEGFDGTILRSAMEADLRGLVAAIKSGAETLEISSKLTAADKMAAVYQAGAAVSDRYPAAWWALRGSMLHFQRRTYECMSYIADDKAAVDYARQCDALFLDLLDNAVEAVATIDPGSPVPKVGAELELEQAFADGTVRPPSIQTSSTPVAVEPVTKPPSDAKPAAKTRKKTKKK